MAYLLATENKCIILNNYIYLCQTFYNTPLKHSFYSNKHNFHAMLIDKQK